MKLNKNYLEYIISKEWFAKRKTIPDKFCYVCGIKKKLNLHHKTYERFKNELPDDLVWICEEHHKKLHEIVRAGKCKLLVAHIFLKQELGIKITPSENRRIRKKKKKRNRGLLKYSETRCKIEAKQHLKFFRARDAVKNDRKDERARIKALREERLKHLSN